VPLGIYAVPNETHPTRLISERSGLQITLFHKRSHLVLCALHNRVFHPTLVTVRGELPRNPVARQRFGQQVFHRCGGDFSVRRVDFSVRRRVDFSVRQRVMMCAINGNTVMLYIALLR